MVNPGGTKQNVTVDLTGAGTLPSSGTAVTLASTSPSDTNSLTAPNHITPTTSTVTGLGSSFSHTFPPYSVTVLTVG